MVPRDKKTAIINCAFSSARHPSNVRSAFSDFNVIVRVGQEHRFVGRKGEKLLKKKEKKEGQRPGVRYVASGTPSPVRCATKGFVNRYIVVMGRA